MTNHFPSFEENQHPEQSNEQYVNLTNQEGWQHFLDVAGAIDEQLVSFNYAASNSEDILDAYDKLLVEAFGTDYDEQKAKAFALADIVDRHDNPTGEQRVLTDDDDVTFIGVIIYPINDQWRVRLAFTPKHQPNPKSPVDYYVPANKYHIANLEVLPKTDQEIDTPIYSDALTILVEKAQASATYTASDEFLDLTPAQQQTRLKSQAKKVGEDFLPSYQDCEVDIVCSQYYAIPDDMATIGFPTEMFYTNQTTLDEKEQFIPSGKILDCTYLEQQDPTRRFNKPADFNLGFGAPCLHVYNKARQCSYFIVPQSIGDIVITDYVEYDD